MIGKFLRRLRRRGFSPPDEIWKGVYRSFPDVPASGDGHYSAEWLDRLRSEVKDVRKSAWSDDFALEHDQLVLLAVALRSFRLLDYGGAAGQTYDYLKRVLPPSVSIEYELIELPNVAELARDLHSVDASVRVGSTLDGVQSSPDIVFVKGVLQYIDDYEPLLRRLFGLGARFVLLEKFSGVAGPSYVSTQTNLAGLPIPYRFISFDGVFAIAEAAGYDRLVWRRLPRIYDQSSFPAELRMGQTSTLVFGRRD
jgi:putative methyltransferase (TIGR04325 family)